jgi:hypothetical protein
LNQADNKEKSVQVQLMGEIYSQAQKLRIRHSQDLCIFENDCRNGRVVENFSSRNRREGASPDIWERFFTPY